MILCVYIYNVIYKKNRTKHLYLIIFLKLFPKSILVLGLKLCFSTHWHSFKIKMTTDPGTNSDLKIHMVSIPSF